jgi:4-alpha-glucanotransferase
VLDALDALDALLRELGSSDADLVLATLEDLWAETDPQNIPGTTSEHANFSRLCALRTDELVNDPHVRAILEHLDAARRAPHRRTA